MQTYTFIKNNPYLFKNKVINKKARYFRTGLNQLNLLNFNHFFIESDAFRSGNL